VNELVALIAFAIAVVSVPAMIPVLRAAGAMDIPNKRSSHSLAVPRGGGIGIVVAFVIAILVVRGLDGAFSSRLLPPMLMIATLGAADDLLGGIPVSLRLAGQALAAAWVTVPAGGITTLPLPLPVAVPLDYLAVPAGIVWVLAVVNIFNFLDGIDGFAAVQTIAAGTALAVSGLGDSVEALGAAVAAASTGFLTYNWHPARVFMGDVGSTSIGFIFAAAPFQTPPATQPFAVLLVVLSLWFFLADGAFTLVRRFARGERIWDAHRTHLYQRWIASGMPHSMFVSRIVPAMLFFCAAGVASVRSASILLSWTALALALVAFAVYVSVTPWQGVGVSKKPKL